LEINKFADITTEEFRSQYLGFKPSKNALKNSNKNIDVHRYDNVADPPTAWDWRDFNVVSYVKNQGQCGSCWSFSATGCIEGAWAIATNNLTSLSEQNIIDCTWSPPYNNTGCEGGDMRAAMQYVINNKGIDSEDSYPYEDVEGGEQEACAYNPKNNAASILSMVDVISGNETDLYYAAYFSPVSVAIDASAESFQFYESGVYSSVECESGMEALDHGVLVVGYGDGYWLVKNSWGSDWGMDGYIQMARDDDNMCGIATYATYSIAY